MRTTITLDDDVAARLKAEARRSGRSFKDVVNDAIRTGLTARRTPPRQRFEVKTRDLGGVRPGLSLDNIEELLDQVEGPMRR